MPLFFSNTLLCLLPSICLSSCETFSGLHFSMVTYLNDRMFASGWEFYGAHGPAAFWLHFSNPCCRVTSGGLGHSAGQHGCRHTCMCIQFWFTDLSCVLLRDVNNHHSLRFPPHSGISPALKEPWRLFWNFYCIKGLVRQQSYFIWNNNRKPTWSAARRDQTTP